MIHLDAFTRAFFEAALFSSNDESTPQGGDPLDRNYSIQDIAEPCLTLLARECERFQRDNASDIEANGPEQAGHDFWMTRNGHGVGFWDGDWPAGCGDRMTADSKLYGEVDLYVGDDGQIWAFGYEPPANPSDDGRKRDPGKVSKRLDHLAWGKSWER